MRMTKLVLVVSSAERSGASAYVTEAMSASELAAFAKGAASMKLFLGPSSSVQVFDYHDDEAWMAYLDAAGAAEVRAEMDRIVRLQTNQMRRRESLGEQLARQLLTGDAWPK